MWFWQIPLDLGGPGGSTWSNNSLYSSDNKDLHRRNGVSPCQDPDCSTATTRTRCAFATTSLAPEGDYRHGPWIQLSTWGIQLFIEANTGYVFCIGMQVVPADCPVRQVVKLALTWYIYIDNNCRRTPPLPLCHAYTYTPIVTVQRALK